MFCVIEFSSNGGKNKDFAAIPLKWFNGTKVRWSKSRENAKLEKTPISSWPTHDAQLATSKYFQTFDEAEAALEVILAQSESESEPALPK